MTSRGFFKLSDCLIIADTSFLLAVAVRATTGHYLAKEAETQVSLL